MTDTDHYHTAGRLIDELRNVDLGSPRESSLIGEAQVHATLALRDSIASLRDAITATKQRGIPGPVVVSGTPSGILVDEHGQPTTIFATDDPDTLPPVVLPITMAAGPFRQAVELVAAAVALTRHALPLVRLATDAGVQWQDEAAQWLPRAEAYLTDLADVDPTYHLTDPDGDGDQ